MLAFESCEFRTGFMHQRCHKKNQGLVACLIDFKSRSLFAINCWGCNPFVKKTTIIFKINTQKKAYIVNPMRLVIKLIQKHDSLIPNFVKDDPYKKH